MIIECCRHHILVNLFRPPPIDLRLLEEMTGMLEEAVSLTQATKIPMSSASGDAEE